jgi:hypothetical protein
LNLANRFRAALHWLQPRCHPDAGQIVEGLFLFMDEFFHYRKPVPVHGEDSSNPDASDMEEDSVTDTPAAEVYSFIRSAPSDSRAEALPISMFWWMSDGPNLVRVKVDPESYGRLFSAYKGTQCVFDFATREWDIFGGWGLAGFNPQD